MRVKRGEKKWGNRTSAIDMGTFREKRGHKLFYMARRSHRKITFTASWRLGNVFFYGTKNCPLEKNTPGLRSLKGTKGYVLCFKCIHRDGESDFFPGTLTHSRKALLAYHTRSSSETRPGSGDRYHITMARAVNENKNRLQFVCRPTAKLFSQCPKMHAL